MGCLLKCVGGLVVLLSLLGGLVLYCWPQPPKIPDVKLGYWAPGQPKPDDKTIRPFKIHATEAELKKLREKLESAIPLTPNLEGVVFDYGMNIDYLNEMIDYWKTKYNWAEREVFLNQYPHFKTQIGGLDIHFMHVKPDPAKIKGKEVVPLLLVHGWPGSVREFYHIMPLLTTPRPDSKYVFEVVAPSLPGYGFSQGSAKKGLCPSHIAVILSELMTRLGFEKFFYQGGDWGSLIGYCMSVLFPKRVLGYHSNFCLAQTSEARLRLLLSYLLPSVFVEKEHQKLFMSQIMDVYVMETGYFHIQATKPDTIGVALTDSPVGLAAYILEKTAFGTNLELKNRRDGGLDKYTKEDLLDNIMMYWLTKSITTSVRLYKEGFNQAEECQAPARSPVQVPVACARFPHEVMFNPKFALEAQYKNLIYIRDFPRGGHFAALEEPKLLADDFLDFVTIVKGKSQSKETEL